MATTLAGLVLVTACASPVPPARPLDREIAAALWAEWLAEVADREALRCSARLSVEGAGPRVRARNRLAVARPIRLRVEVQGFLGTTAGVLTVDDETYAFLRADPRVFESGPVDEALLGRVVGVPIAPATIVAVLLGAPGSHGPSQVVAGSEQFGGVREVRFDDGAAARFDAAGRLVGFRAGASAEASGWNAEFADYAAVGDAWIAHRLRLEVDDGPSAQLVLRDVELNPALSPDIFRLDDLAPAAGPGAGVPGG